MLKIESIFPMINILIADDDVVDRELFSEGMQQTKRQYQLTEVSNGEELLTHLETTTIYPDLIVLDFNMPVKDGRETLKEIKANDKFKHIPVFVLSTSNAKFDVSLAYESGANLFMVKPHNFKSLVEMLSCLLTLLEKYVSFENSIKN